MNKVRQKKKRSIPLIVIMCAATFISIFPFYVMIIMGTHYNEDLFKQIQLLPGTYLLNNLKTVINGNFFRAYWNSFYIAVTATVLAVLVSAMAGYAFAKFRFKGRGVLHGFVLATMMIPQGLGLVAFTMEMKAFGWNQTHLPFIVPWAANVLGVFLMTQSMKDSVPTEILESARIDGCGELRLFFSFVIGLSKPIILTLGLLVFLSSWNNFLIPLVMINKQDMFTIPLAMYSLGAVYRTDYAARVLGLTLGTLPLILLFLFNSKSFIQGLAAGAVKG